MLATAGTGDVLAGMVGANLAKGLQAFDAACSAVFRHGRAADEWQQTHTHQALTASKLAAASSQNYQGDLQRKDQDDR